MSEPCGAPRPGCGVFISIQPHSRRWLLLPALPPPTCRETSCTNRSFILLWAQEETPVGSSCQSDSPLVETLWCLSTAPKSFVKWARRGNSSIRGPLWRRGPNWPWCPRIDCTFHLKGTICGPAASQRRRQNSKNGIENLLSLPNWLKGLLIQGPTADNNLITGFCLRRPQ